MDFQSGAVPEIDDNFPGPDTTRTGWPWTERFEPEAQANPPDGEPWPRISIIVPSYNQRAFIEESLRSVLLQGYPDLEMIVMDGGSTDGSVEVIKKYEPWLAHWESGPDGGYTNAVNEGWRRATGEVLGWLNSDDLYLPGALWRVAAEFRTSKFMVFAGATNIVDKNSALITSKGGSSFDPLQILTDVKPGSPATFYGREVLQTVGFLRTDLVYNPDREFILRIASKFWPAQARTIEAPLAAWRKWEDTVTGSGGRIAVAERILVVDEFLNSPYRQKLPGTTRIEALKRIYMAQANRERDRGDLLHEIRYRLLAFRQAPSGLAAAKILVRSAQLVLILSARKLGFR